MYEEVEEGKAEKEGEEGDEERDDQNALLTSDLDEKKVEKPEEAKEGAEPVRKRPAVIVLLHNKLVKQRQFEEQRRLQAEQATAEYNAA